MSVPDTFAAAFLRLRQLVADSTEAQWQAGRREQPRDDTTERSKGVTSDPTYATVADERRLRLRAAVVAAETELEEAGRAMQRAERHLTDALEGWHNA